MIKKPFVPEFGSFIRCGGDLAPMQNQIRDADPTGTTNVFSNVLFPCISVARFVGVGRLSMIHDMRLVGTVVSTARQYDEGIWDEDSVTKIKGIGKSTRKLLARMGIKTVRQFARLRKSRITRLTKKRGVTVAKVHRWIDGSFTFHPMSF